MSEILKEVNLTEGKNVIVEAVNEFKYPLKVVVTMEDESITVLTAYPLKKGLIL